MRLIASALPQILILLFLGGWLDILGGFNHTDLGFNTFMLLFLGAPVVTFVFIIVESLKYRRHVKYEQGTGSLVWRNISIILFIETLAICLLILSTFRM